MINDLIWQYVLAGGAVAGAIAYLARYWAVRRKRTCSACPLLKPVSRGPAPGRASADGDH